MNPSENALLAPKYGLMDSEALLGQFAKYTLAPYPLIQHPKQHENRFTGYHTDTISGNIPYLFTPFNRTLPATN